MILFITGCPKPTCKEDYLEETGKRIIERSPYHCCKVTKRNKTSKCQCRYTSFQYRFSSKVTIVIDSNYVMR